MIRGTSKAISTTTTTLEVTPAVTYLVRSPGYSHPDRGLFEDFLGRLVQKLGGAFVTRLPAPSASPLRRRGLLARLENRVVLALRRHGLC